MNIENLTIEYLIQEYCHYIELKLKPQSVLSIKTRFRKYIIPYFKDKKIIEIDSHYYLGWQKYLNEQLFSYSYKKALHYTMVQLYSYLEKFYDYRNNVPKKVGKFVNSDIPQEMNYWSLKEYTKFIESFSVNDKIYKCFFDFLFFTGCRLGEANAITFNDVNADIVFINKTISKSRINGRRQTTRPKTKKSIRNIRIDSCLVAQIKDLQDYYTTQLGYFNDNFYIFGGNKPLSPSTINRKMNLYSRLSKVKKIRVHDIRHSHATLLLENGIPIHAISNRLGHEDINTTINTYTHLMPEYEKRVSETLNSLHKI